MRGRGVTLAASCLVHFRGKSAHHVISLLIILHNCPKNKLSEHRSNHKHSWRQWANLSLWKLLRQVNRNSGPSLRFVYIVNISPLFEIYFRRLTSWCMTISEWSEKERKKERLKQWCRFNDQKLPFVFIGWTSFYIVPIISNVGGSNIDSDFLSLFTLHGTCTLMRGRTLHWN